MKKHFLSLGSGCGLRLLRVATCRGALLLALSGLGPAGHAQLFGPSTLYPTGMNPYTVALGDVNGDGHPDLVTANFNSGAGTISVLLGTGSGTFGANTEYPTGAIPQYLALGDVNGDSRLDIVTANPTSNSASVLLNTGAGAFGPPTVYPTGKEPRSVALGDVNSDGRPDLVIANTDPFSGIPSTVSVRLNTGAGDFGPKTDYSTGNTPYCVALGDVNGDGRPDLITANFGYGTNTASVLLNTGAGVFGPKTDYPTGGGAVSVALGDVNGDGRLDIVTANLRSFAVSVLLNVGAGAFGPKTDYPIGHAPNDVALGDLNGDSRLDIVTVNIYGTATVQLNTGAGTFGLPTRFNPGSTPLNLVLGDVNGDGRPDLVTAFNSNNTVSVLLNASTNLGVRANLTAAGGELYPNPARADFTVLLPSSIAGTAGNPLRVDLVDALGRVVRQQVAFMPAAGAGLGVDATGLPVGVYTLLLLVGATVLHQQVVLQ